MAAHVTEQVRAALETDRNRSNDGGKSRRMTASMSVAIDGPVASGKSTVGRSVAQSLGYLYLDTGVMYRAIASLARAGGVNPSDERAVTEIARNVRFSFPQLDRAKDANPPLLVDGVDITATLRDPAVDRDVSIVSAYKGVREAMVEQQRAIGSVRPVVMVGRDIGTIVLPDAKVKVFLTATVAQRAARRHLERVAAGANESIEQTEDDIKRRDKLDSERALSPLKPAEDAIVVDTTGMDADAAVETVVGLVKARIRDGDGP